MYRKITTQTTPCVDWTHVQQPAPGHQQARRVPDLPISPTSRFNGSDSLAAQPRRPSDDDLATLQQMEMAGEGQIPPPPPLSYQERLEQQATQREQHLNDGIGSGTLSDSELRLRTKQAIDAYRDILAVRKGEITQAQELAILNKCVDMHERAFQPPHALKDMPEICLRAFVLYARQGLGVEIGVKNRGGGRWAVVPPAESLRAGDQVAAVRAGLMLRLAHEWQGDGDVNSVAVNQHGRGDPYWGKAVGWTSLSQREIDRLVKYGDENWPALCNVMQMARSAVADHVATLALTQHLPDNVVNCAADYANSALPHQPTPFPRLHQYATDMEDLLNSEFLEKNTKASRHLTDKHLRDRTETTIHALFDVLKAPDGMLTEDGRLAILNKCVDMHERAFKRPYALKVMPEICLRAFAIYARQATGREFSVRWSDYDQSVYVGPDYSKVPLIANDSTAAVRAGLMLRLAFAWTQDSGTTVICRSAKGLPTPNWDDARINTASFTQSELDRLTKVGHQHLDFERHGSEWWPRYFDLTRKAHKAFVKEVTTKSLTDPPARIGGGDSRLLR